jgi:murein DD-endopeptidase MepM/ murein hydrolase activator NlpD
MRVNPVSGVRRNHNGVDFGANSGTAILAIAAGVIEAKGKNLSKTNGFGHWVRVRQYDGSIGFYAHMKAASPLPAGAKVDHSTTVGSVGTTGASTGPHLHYEVIISGKPVDPVTYANARSVGAAASAAARVHVVARGESLSAIASRYGTTWQALYALNRDTIGANPNRIFAGQALTVSTAKTVKSAKPAKSAPVAAARVHVVARGESLSKIAAQYGTTWQKIHSDNRVAIGSNPNRIFAGQRLTIR